MEDTVRIVAYEPRFQPAFQALNEAWITEHYALEPQDVAVLTDPQRLLLDTGGLIFMALLHEEPVGTCGLRRVNATTFELTKMAVAAAVRGQGIGELLARHALRMARAHRAERVKLFTQKALPAAYALYRKLGFEEIELPLYPYARADTYMELSLANLSR
ncbi:GNAT family N-acetyltransferase [Hymenobacter puniceus]|uniref:GNAT family N-acetyltransferase n=1 Tax=Hymenobacter sp. BT190 TaxID=2763505 RepID=UPI0016515D5E|nr:GNAT family N-acetyltransferase [Hymenobacter sp. BT190]MBC6700127.1 GNAT family N-acetyltransferase [Hymenobacter sp. BT190]